MNPRSLIGRELAGKYTLESMIGLGGFGAVYRALQAPIDRVVAVKVNLHAHRSDLRARFVREARLQAELRHPGCVMLLDCGETEGLFYLVQEFVDGRSLKAALADGPIEPRRAVELVGQVLDALGEAHRHHIVHRDIKPANIMLTLGAEDREEVRVLDFGIAKLLVGGDDDESLTGTGMSLGTPAYMAPEQIRPGLIGPPTDIYAVGALLYRLLAGTAVFSGATIDVLNQQLHHPPPALPAGLHAFDGIIARAMAKPSEQRYQSAAEMRRALADIDWGAVSTPAPPSGLDMTLELGATLVTPPTALGEAPTPSPAPVASSRAPTPPPAPRPDAPATRRRAVWLIGLGLSLAGAVMLAKISGSSGDPAPGVADGAAALADAGPGDGGPGDGPPARVLDGAVDAAAPDATPPDATPPDATPPPPRPRVDPAALQRRFEQQLTACECPAARRTLATIRRVDASRVAALARRHEAACVLFIPGNCQTR